MRKTATQGVSPARIRVRCRNLLIGMVFRIVGFSIVTRASTPRKCLSETHHDACLMRVYVTRGVDVREETIAIC